MLTLLLIHKGSAQKWVCLAIMDNGQLPIKQSASKARAGQETGGVFFSHHVDSRAGEPADGSPPPPERHRSHPEQTL